MDKATALSVFTALESQRSVDDEPQREYKPPTFDVRLDAGSAERRAVLDGGIERTYRLRLAPSKWGPPTSDDWRYVLEIAEENGLTVDLQNSAMEMI